MKKFKAFSVISVFSMTFGILFVPNAAHATAPTLNWTASSLTTTSTLSSNLAMISEDGTTKINATGGGSSGSVYVSRNGGSWTLATGTSQLSYARSGSVSASGQYVAIASTSGGQSIPVVLVSNNYGTSFTASSPFTGVSPRYSINCAMSPDGRTIVLGSVYYSGLNNQTSNSEIVVSNDFGATWEYKSLGQGGLPEVHASSASYLGTGKNAIYVDNGGSTLLTHIFSSSDSGAISGSLTDVVGTNSSDNNLLAQTSRFGVTSDGTKAFVTVSYTMGTVYNVVIESSGSWTFGSAVTPTFTSLAPSSLGSGGGSVRNISISPDGQKVGMVADLYVNPSITLYGYISQDSGATFTPVYSGASYAEASKFTFSSNSPSKVYTIKNSGASISIDGGQNFTTDVLSITAAAKVTDVVGSADGSLLALTVSSISGPPSIYLSRDSGATATVIDGTAGASNSYNQEAFVASDGSRLVLNVNNYQNQTNILKEFYGSNFASSRTLNLPSGVTSLGGVVFNSELSKILIFARTSGANGNLFYGTISSGTVTWSSALGDLTSYTGLAVTNVGIHAISVSQSKLYQAPISNGTLGTLTSNTSPFANGFTGVWSPMKASADGSKLVVANYGTISSNCYTGGYIYKSVDAGATWSVIPTGASLRQVGPPTISADGSYIAYGVASGGYMNLSVDGGATFDNLTDLGTLTCPGTVGGTNRWRAAFLYSPNGTNLGIASPSSTFVLNVATYTPGSQSLSAQTISFTNPSAMTVGDADQTLTVSASSSLAVTLSTANASICTIVSGKVHAVAAGTCSITAAQAGNSSYSAATNVTRTFTVSASSQLTAEQIAAQLEAERVAIELARQAAIAKAKLALHENLQGNKPGTFEEYKAAEYMVNNQRVVASVNAAVLKLPLADRENAEKIAAIIKVENFVDLVSTPATQKYVTSKNLVDLGLIAASNPNKTTVALALKNGNVASLNTIEKIQDAIKAELVSIQARKDRLASIKAKIAARNK